MIEIVAPRLLTAAEVAAQYRVSSRTVGRWGRQARITAVRTPSGQSRYYQIELEALLLGATAVSHTIAVPVGARVITPGLRIPSATTPFSLIERYRAGRGVTVHIHNHREGEQR
nr:hypothetical protein [Micromonospora sp. DSM 115978]